MHKTDHSNFIYERGCYLLNTVLTVVDVTRIQRSINRVVIEPCHIQHDTISSICFFMTTWLSRLHGLPWSAVFLQLELLDVKSLFSFGVFFAYHYNTVDTTIELTQSSILRLRRSYVLDNTNFRICARSCRQEDSNPELWVDSCRHGHSGLQNLSSQSLLSLPGPVGRRVFLQRRALKDLIPEHGKTSAKL